MTPSTQITMQPPDISFQQPWQMLLDQLYAQIDRQAFNDYVRDTRVLDFSEGVLTLAAPSAYARDWLSSRLASTIRRQIAPLVGQPVELRVIFEEAPTLPTAGDSANSAQKKNGTFRVVEINKPIEPPDSEANRAAVAKKTVKKTAQRAGNTAGLAEAAPAAPEAFTLTAFVLTAPELQQPASEPTSAAILQPMPEQGRGSADSRGSVDNAELPLRAEAQTVLLSAGEADERDCDALMIEESADSIE